MTSLFVIRKSMVLFMLFVMPLITFSQSISLTQYNSNAAQNLAEGVVDVPVFTFTAYFEDESLNTSLNRLGITLIGNYDAADITELKLWYNPNQADVDADAVLLKTISNPGAQSVKLFDNLVLQPMTPAGDNIYFVTVSLAAGSSSGGNKFYINTVLPSDIDFTEGTPTGSVPASGQISFVTPCNVSNFNNTISVNTNPACTSTTLKLEGSTSNRFWQTSQDGTSNAFPATSLFTVTQSGIYYVRIFSNGCWSTWFRQSAFVTINTPPAITTQPQSSSIRTGSNVSFSVAATGTNLGYQWQESTNGGGIWTNLIDNESQFGTLTNQLTLKNNSTVDNGNLYRCVVKGASPCPSVNSNSATLTVFAGVVYRSKLSGPANWEDIASWDSSVNNINFFPSTSVPGALASNITITAGQHLVINSDINLVDASINVQANATLDANAAVFNISGTGFLNVTGRIITENLNGLSGGTNANFPTGWNINLLTGNTVTYESSLVGGTQLISARTDYTNLVIAGGQTKQTAGVVMVSKSLTLTAGVVNTSAANLLVLAPGCIITGGSINSFINGPLKVQTTNRDKVVFPVGKSSPSPVYEPIGITPVTIFGTTAFTVEHIAGNPSIVYPANITIAPPSALLKKGSWQVDREGFATGRVSIPYSNPGADGWSAAGLPPAGSNVVVAHYVSSPSLAWETTVANNQFSISGATPESLPFASNNVEIFSGVLNSFSPFTLGYGSSNILPITVLSFKALSVAENAQLQWEIADIADLDYFEIEHSLNGRNFTKLANVGKNGGRTYGYQHKSPGQGLHYYRLAIHERNGNKKYSSTQLVQIGAGNKTVIKALLQNPVNALPVVEVFTSNAQLMDVAVVNASGILLKHWSNQLMAGNNQFRLQTSVALPSGSYYVHVKTADGSSKTLRWLKN